MAEQPTSVKEGNTTRGRTFDASSNLTQSHAIRLLKTAGIVVALAAIYVWAWRGTGFSVTQVVDGLPNMVDFISRMLPPHPDVLHTAADAVVETIQIAVLGTTFGAIVALPLAFLAARNIAPFAVHTAARTGLNLIRTIPSIVWALFFVSVVGLGPVPGVLALTLYSAGTMGKLYFEGLEAINRQPVEAIAATGAGKLQTVRYGVIPQFMPYLMSYTLYQFEYNVRAAAILGVVGAGGVGFYIQMYVQTFQYDKLTTLLIVLLVAVIAIDWLSSKIRSRML